MKNLLLIYGGGGTEHEVSLRSAQYFKDQIDTNKFKIIEVEITKKGRWEYERQECFLNLKKQLVTNDELIEIDLAIPSIHGFPNESGQLPAMFELMGLPFLGCGQEASVLCFNKMSTKLWLENAGIKTTPFICLTSMKHISKAEDFFVKNKNDVFVKASNQGSSVGCYHCQTKEELVFAISEAFTLSPFVVLEKKISGREFELSCFEYDSKIHFTHPCEIFAPGENFYTYEQKYSNKSQTKVETIAKIPKDVVTEMKRQAEIAFDILKIRHLSRIDFFLCQSGNVYLNEINTMPGHTKISMFPVMMENYGVKYSDFLAEHLLSLSNS